MSKKTRGILLVTVTMLLILISGAVYALDGIGTYTGKGVQTPEFQPNPFAYYQGNIQNYWSAFNEKDCQARQDFLVQILPGSCSPAVVRSDLLEENNLPVFCRLTGVKINPLINVPEITSITFKPQNRTITKDIVNIGFHPAQAAVKTWGSKLIGSPVLDNLGYLVVILRSQPSEKNMSKWIQADLTARITYNAENAFGIGRANFVTPEISSDEEWQQTYQEYGFWKGKGYVRVAEISKDASNVEYARIAIYTDANRVLSSFSLKKGQTSSEIYLPGYYCQAGFTVNLLDINQPKDKARIIFDDDEMWVSKGQRISDECTVSDVKAEVFGGGKIKINCGFKTYVLEKKPPKAKITVRDKNGKDEISSKEFAIGEDIISAERIILAYVGNTRKALDSGLRQQNKDFIIIAKIGTKESISAETLSEQISARTRQLLEGKAFTGFGIFGLAKKEAINSISTLQQKLNDYFNVKKIYITIIEAGGLTKTNENFGDREFFFESLAGIYEESYTSYDKGKLLEEYYSKAEKAYTDIAANHGAEREWQKEGVETGEYYGAEALYKAATLAGELKKFKTQKELLEQIKEQYPDSLLAATATRELEKLIGNDVSGSSIVVYTKEGKTHFITLVDLQSAGSGKTAKISYSVQEKPPEEGDYSEKDSFGDGIIVDKINDESVQFRYPAKGWFGESTITIEQGKDSVIYLSNGKSVRIFVKSITIAKEANIQIMPRVERAETEANFTFKIAVEKRAIQLSPEKTKEMINDLDKTIAEWESITNNLKKLVEGWKGTCFAGSAFLMAKAFFANLDGSSIGRQMAMDKWKVICKEEVAEAKSQGITMTESQCFMKHNNEINEWTKFYTNKAKEINNMAKACKDIEGVLQTSKYLGIFEQHSLNEEKFIDKCKGNIIASSKDLIFANEKQITIEGGLSGKSQLKEYYKRAYGTSKFRDPDNPNNIISWDDLVKKIETNTEKTTVTLLEGMPITASEVFNDESITLLREKGYLSSEDFKDIMMTLETKEQCKNAQTQEDKNYCKSIERDLYNKIDYFKKRATAEEERKNYRDSFSRLKISFSDIGDVPEIKDTISARVGDAKKPSEDEKSILSNQLGWSDDYYIAPLPYHFVDKEEYTGMIGTVPLLLKLKWIRAADDGTHKYSIEDAAIAGETVFTKLGKQELNQLKSTVGEISYLSPGKYRNEYKNPEVRYWESGLYKGKPALVPLGRHAKDGWYVATQPYTLGTKAFTEAGQIWNFWICNVGSNGIEQFSSPSHGDDAPCQGFMPTTGQPTDRLAGLDEKKAAELISAAQDALRQAQNQYGKKRVMIDGKEFNVGRPEVETSQMQCEDFMSPADCTLLFNLCDPVLCPASRCDFGGRYPVADVIQTGVVGSILLCLPNAGSPDKGGVIMPVCLTGIHAGLDMYTKTLKMMRDCLQEHLKTGKMVGICDQMTSIYKCEFFWKQAVPLIKIGIPYVIELIKGERTRGGGEYMFVQNAWDNLDKSVDYFTNYYGVNALKAFQAKSLEQAGTEICKMYVSANYPSSADFFKKLVEPESPTQFHAEFSEDIITEATVPPTSHYKVSYRIYAGNDQGIYYQIYLKGAPTTEYYQVMQTLNVPNAMGYLPAGEYVSQSIDFTAPTGYKELCVQINGQEKCGFKQVTTSFMFDEIKNLYIKDEATAAVATESECISGKASLMPIALGTNPEAAIQEAIQPAIYKRGIIRICATDNPGLQTESGRWRNVGYCGDTKIRCWLDTYSLNNTISDLGLLEETLEEAKAREDEINQEKLMTDAECSDKLITAIKLKDKKKEDIDKLFRDSISQDGKLTVSIANFENGLESLIEEVITKFEEVINECGFSEYRVKARFAVAELYQEITERLYFMSEKGKKPETLPSNIKTDNLLTKEETGLDEDIIVTQTIETSALAKGTTTGKTYQYEEGRWQEVTTASELLGEEKWAQIEEEAANLYNLNVHDSVDIYLDKGQSKKIKFNGKEAEIKFNGLKTKKLRGGYGIEFDIDVSGKGGAISSLIDSEALAYYEDDVENVDNEDVKNKPKKEFEVNGNRILIEITDWSFTWESIELKITKIKPFMEKVGDFFSNLNPFKKKVNADKYKLSLSEEGILFVKENIKDIVDEPTNRMAQIIIDYRNGGITKEEAIEYLGNEGVSNDNAEIVLSRIESRTEPATKVEQKTKSWWQKVTDIFVPELEAAETIPNNWIDPGYNSQDFENSKKESGYAERKSIYLIINEYAKKYDVNFNLIRAIIQKESNWKPSEVTAREEKPGTAVGYMGLTMDAVEDMATGTCKNFCGFNINRNNIEQNIKGGICFYACQYDEFRDVNLALAAYKEGPPYVRDYCSKDINKCRNPLFSSKGDDAKNYVRRIMEIYDNIMTQQEIALEGGGNKKVIVIDPGHGGSDPGALNPYNSKQNEEDITLDIAYRLEAVLESKGYAVTLTRVADETVSLERRVEISNNAKGMGNAADLFISIHSNSAGIEGQPCTATGTQVAYYRDTKSFTPELAKDIAESISAATGLTLRKYEEKAKNIKVVGGVYGAAYQVIGKTNNAPAIYIETAFICNKDDEGILTNYIEQEQIAAAISQSVSMYV